MSRLESEKEAAVPAEGTTHANLSLLTITDKPQALLDIDKREVTWGVKLIEAYGRVIGETPGKVSSTLADDISNHPLETLGKAGAAAGLGLASAVLLARSPVAGKTLLTALGVGGTIAAADAAFTFSKEVTYTDSAEARNNLASQASTSLARFSADFIETTPSLAAGVKLGLGLSSRSATLQELAGAVQNKIEFPLRTAMPEKLHYISFDAQTVSAGNAGKSVGLLEASERMLQTSPWRGMEDARLFKLQGNDVKISGRLPGTPFETMVGSRKDMAFHTHRSEVLPSSSDYTSVRKIGVIGIPEEGILTFYEGKALEAEKIQQALAAKDTARAAALRSELESSSLATLVVDSKKGLSVSVEMKWSPLENRLYPAKAQPVNFEDAVKNLSKMPSRLNIEEMGSPTHLYFKPGMLELLQKITGV